MNKKILIVDDENPTRHLIKKMINSFGLNLDVYTDGENVKTAISAIERIQPDLVILDIQMPDGNGFDVLKAIPDKKFEVIFITAYQEYAIQAIKFSALDYILKPLAIDELKAALLKAIKSLDQKKSNYPFVALDNNVQAHKKKKLILKTLESMFIVDIDNIVRCESDKNYTFFFFAEGKKILVSKTLKEYDMLLSDLSFFRVQQSHLINMNYVDRYDKHEGGCVIMKDGTQIPLSQAKKEQFFKMLETL